MLTDEQIRQREYLQKCVDEVRSKKYINTLIEELNYLLIHVNDIALDLARGRKFRDIHKDFLVGITTSEIETHIVLQGIFGNKILPARPQMFKSQNHNVLNKDIEENRFISECWEKQIPLKVTDLINWKCPRCGNEICGTQEAYCPFCGQRLEW